MSNYASTKSTFADSGIKPSKRLGQNFLVDKNALKKLADAAELTKDDIVLEVGAGTGTLTVELAKRAKRVIAVEKDRDLIPLLRDAIKKFENVQIAQGDILKLTIDNLPLTIDKADKGRGSMVNGQWSMVGNIPYYLTAPLIRIFLETENPPQAMTLMVQKEMAQRICAKPPDMSILAVSVQVYAKPEIVSYISRSAFWPQPKVDSAIIKITPKHSGQLSIVNCQLFFAIVKAGFSSPRKQLINNLSRGLGLSRKETEQWLLASDIAPERRAETLTVKEWITLTRNML